MGELRGLYAVWLREAKVFTRETSRLVSALITPLMWLVIFGTGLGSVVSITGVNYQQFIYPGILVLTVLFGSLFFGLYIILDKRVDFLKEVLVAPMSRTTVFFGKVLGGSTDGLVQIVILLVLGAIFFGIHFTIYSFLVTIVTVFLLMVALVSIGIAFGSMMNSPEGFGLVSSFVVFPLFFLSGALFPVTSLPTWLKVIVRFNPVSYGVDAMRGVLLGIGAFSTAYDLTIVAAFALAMVILGSSIFKRMKI